MPIVVVGLLCSMVYTFIGLGFNECKKNTPEKIFYK